MKEKDLKICQKAICVIESVTTVEQLEAAKKYSDLAISRISQHWQVICQDIYKMLLKDKKRKFNKES